MEKIEWLKDYAFWLVGAPGTSDVAANWLRAAGGAVTEVSDWAMLEELGEHDAAERVRVALGPEPVVPSPALAAVALVGAWGVRPPEDTSTRFWIDPAGTPAAAAEVLRLASAARRHRTELYSVGRNLTHDLMTPLGAVMTGAATLAGSPDLPAEDRELVESIVVSGREMKHLISRVGLMLSASVQRTPLEEVDMTDVFWQLRDLHEARLARKQAQLELPADGGKVRGVTKWVLRIWDELIANALTHNPPGRRLTVRVEPADAVIRYVLRDDGAGVRAPKETLLLPLHQRGSRSGRGWGLTIVERLVALQGGAVGYREPAAGGAEFYFELPRV